MKLLIGHPFDLYRDVSAAVLDFYGTVGDAECGVFLIPSLAGTRPIRVVASSGMGWDHVSASLPNRCPNWPEMSQIKRIFFHDDEWAMELHPPPSDNLSLHPYCLHLWRPHEGAIPLPPPIMVAPPTQVMRETAQA